MQMSLYNHHRGMAKRNVTFFHFIVVILCFGFGGCDFHDAVEKSDKEFVASIKKDSVHASILALDSAIKKQKYDGLRKALLFFEQGKSWSRIHNSKKAIQSFESALAIFQKYDEKVYLAKTHWLLGSEHAYLSNKEASVDHLLKALNYARELNNAKEMANTYSALAHVYFQYQDFDRSIEYTLQAIELQKQLQDTVGLSATYNNMAVVYRNMGNYMDAIDYNMKSLDLNIQLNQKSAIAKSYNNLGLLSEGLADYPTAIDYYQKAIHINKDLGIRNANPLKNLGNLYLYSGDLDKAESVYLNALTIVKENEDLANQRDIYGVLLNIALRNKDYDQAIRYAGERDFYMQAQSKKDLEEKLALAENQYKLAASENELSMAHEVNRREKIIFIVIISLILLSVMFWIQSVKNKKLKAEKEKMVLEQNVLRSQMNPHFIFNALSAIQNSLLDNDPIQSATYLSRFAKLIRQNFEFINETTISLADEIDLLKNYMNTQLIRFKDKFDFDISVSGLDIEETEIPPMLLQPFVENAIEHGFKNMSEKGHIAINIKGEQSVIKFEIKDNGKGVSIRQKDDKIHSIDVFLKRLQLLGNKDESSFAVSSSEKGTTVKFNLKQ